MATPTTEIYTLSLHDALPISCAADSLRRTRRTLELLAPFVRLSLREQRFAAPAPRLGGELSQPRSEEHTSELQSLRHLVCRLLLEKKKKIKTTHIPTHTNID